MIKIVNNKDLKVMKKYTEKTIKYYDKIADDYIKSTAAVVLEDKIKTFIKFLSGKKILDVACGPGHDTNYLNKMGFDCLGIDLSEKMIDLAKQNFKGKFEVMDFFDLKLKKESFDGMWCSSIFVHIKKDDLPTLLLNAKKVLKKNGVIGIITAKKQTRERSKDDTREYVMYDQKELEDYLKQAGFTILFSDIFTYGYRNRLFLIAKKVS